MLTRREALFAAAGTMQAPARDISISDVVATAPLGLPIDVATSGWLPKEQVLWSILRRGAPGSAEYLRRSGVAYADADGTAIVRTAFAAPSEFLRVRAADGSRHRDSLAVTTQRVAAASAGNAAFRFRDGLRHGVNFERWRPVTMNFRGYPTARSQAYYRYLKDQCGVNYVRFHYPWHNTENMLGNGVTIASGRRPSIESIRQFLQPPKQCASAGLKVIIDFIDVCSWDVLNQHWSRVAAHLEDFAREIASAPELSPEACAVGPYSELIEWKSSNLEYNQLRLNAHGILRALLPNHIIVHGANRWDDWTSLTAKDWAPPPDRLSMGTWHGYFAADSGPQFWNRIQTAMREFSRRVGIPTFCGEAGLDDFGTVEHQRFSSRWLLAIEDQTKALPDEKPCWWAVTDGSMYRMSVGGSDATLIPDLAAKLAATSGRLVSR